MVHCTQIRFYRKWELPIPVQKLLFTSRLGAQEHSTVLFYSGKNAMSTSLYFTHSQRPEIPTLKTCTVTHNAQNSFGTRLIKKLYTTVQGLLITEKKR